MSGFDGTGGERLLFPIGHHLGSLNRPPELAEQGPSPGPAHQVRLGPTVHDLTHDRNLVWALAHGSPDAIENGVPWQRRSVQELAKQVGLPRAATIIDELADAGLLVEVTPGTEQALHFAETHRVVPLMLGLGNTSDEPWLFGIGFLGQPLLQVTHSIYDLWQWSSMDETLWATCRSAADVARRANLTEPDKTDPEKLLTSLLRSMHALLVSGAACLDIAFRLRNPD